MFDTAMVMQQPDLFELRRIPADDCAAIAIDAQIFAGIDTEEIHPPSRHCVRLREPAGGSDNREDDGPVIEVHTRRTEFMSRWKVIGSTSANIDSEGGVPQPFRVSA